FAASFGSSLHSEILDLTIRSRGFDFTAARFSSLPVERSSITTTRLPLLSRRSTKCDPINPAPPVTRTNEDGEWRMACFFGEYGGWKMEDGRSRDVFTKVVRAPYHFVYAGPD